MPSGDRVALAAFIGGTVCAGANGVCIRFSNRELAPYWGATWRFWLAAAVLAPIAVVFRRAFPRGRALGGAVLYGIVQFAGGFGLTYYALVRIHAGLGQTLLALSPLVTLLIATAQGQERVRAAALIGGLLALGGVAVLSRSSLEASVPLLSLLALGGALVCFGEAFVIARELHGVDPIAMNVVGMGAAGAVLFVISLIAREPLDIPQRTATWVAIAYLASVGSGVVFSLGLVVLKYWEASRFAYIFVVLPPIAVLFSAWLDDEPLGIELLFGGALILTGVYIGALRRTRTPVEAA